MGMSAGGGSGGLTSEPNMTPMIDVLLVLLIIFMMIVPASRKTIDLQLPAPNPAPSQPQNQNIDQIVLEVLPNSYYEINNEPVNGVPALETRLQQVYDGRPDKVIFVKGAYDVTYQDVIGAMDAARGAGVTVIGIPPKESEQAKVGK